MRLIEAAIRYRDGVVIRVSVSRGKAMDLRRAGFLPYILYLTRDDGSRVDADLWSQDPPRLTDYLNAGVVVFETEPGSLSWASGPPRGARMPK